MKKSGSLRWEILILILSTLMIVLTACGENSGEESSDKIKIGVLLSFTGTFAPLSESIQDGFQLYLNQNDNKLGGREVEIITKDVEEDPKTALNKYRQLVQGEGVDILVGPISSSVAYALRDKVDQDEMVLLDPNAAANDLSWERKSDYVYRTSFSNWQNGHAAAEYIYDNIGKKAVAIAPDYAAGEEVVSSFKNAYEEAGGEVIEEMYPELGTNDFATYLTKIQKLDPDVVYSFATGSDAINFIKQYDSFGLKGKIPLTGTLEYGDGLVTEPTGESSEDVISGINYSPKLENEVNEKFVDDYKAEYDKLPNIFSVEGFDTAQVIDQAVTEAGSTDSGELVKALKGISFDSPRGPITIDPETNNPIQNFYIGKNVMEDEGIVPEVLETIEDVEMPASSPSE